MRQRHSSLLTSLLQVLRPYGRELTAAFAALSVAAGVVIFIGWQLRSMVDAASGALTHHHLNAGLSALLISALVMAGASFTRSTLMAWVSERAVADLKHMLFQHLLRLDRYFYDWTRVGELLSRLQADLTLIQTLLSSSLSTGARSLIQLIGALTLLLFTSVKLFALAMLVIPAALIPLIVLGSWVRGRTRATSVQQGAIAAFLKETLSAVTTYQAYGNEERGVENLTALLRQGLNPIRQRILARGFLVASAFLIIASSVAFILWIGAHDVLSGRLSPGELTSFIFYAVVTAGSLNSLSETWSDVQNVRGACDRLWELLRTPVTLRTLETPQICPFIFTQIRFENVSFAYPTRLEIQALQDVSFTLNQGESIALIGPSGAGKSTLFHLLMRFYDPLAGSITFNGEDIRRLDLKEMRRRIGWVSQEAVIFAASVYENIRFGKIDATPEEIEQAARAAHAFEFIRALPQGFETALGEQGVRLSGGQRQRLALARALLKDPSLLLLDEATNAVDAESEHLIQKALTELMCGRTTVMAAHRLSTVLKAQRIIVIMEGKIVGDGVHAKVYRDCEWYRQFVDLQARGQGIVSSEQLSATGS